VQVSEQRLRSNPFLTSKAAIPSVSAWRAIPPETSASEEITRLLQRLCGLPTNAVMSEQRAEAQRPQAFMAAR
jgi:hypothetical protein